MSASEEMDRIVFTFWFTTVICIADLRARGRGDALHGVNFRVRPETSRRAADPRPHGLEIAWTAIPALLVTAISIVSAVVLARTTTPAESAPIDVTAQQFAWKFEYPGDPK